jgi:hypothetical protein
VSFILADRSINHKLQQCKIGSALADPFLDKRGQCINIGFIDEASASVFLQTAETIDMGEADL